jgi:prolyl oligopeptidase
MRSPLLLVNAAVLSLVLTACMSNHQLHPPFVYPETKKIEHTDNYHGTSIADPFRWLEDDNSPETKAWVEAQNEVTFGYLESIPAREKIKSRLQELWDYERYGVPHKRGDRIFFSRNDGLQNQAIVYTALGNEQPTVLLDPNQLSSDGTVALGSYSTSEDGRYFAYAISTAGSDWQEIKVRDVSTGKDLPDHLKWVKFSGATWTRDGKGFFYSRYDEPIDADRLKGVNYFQKLYFHILGTPQSEDTLIYHRPDEKEWGFGHDVTEDNRYLVISIWKGTDTRNRIFYKDLADPKSEVVPLLNDFDAQYSFINSDDPVFWFYTESGAPRGKVIAVDIRNPGRNHWKEIIPQTADTLRNVSMLNNQFVASYLKDAHTIVKFFAANGRFIRELDLPAIGSAGGFSGNRDDTETFYSYSSFTVPGSIYHLDLRTGQSTVFREPKLTFDPERFETKQVFYESKDGTRIPMFIVHKQGMKLNGHNPTILYGYGGFSISLTPGFSPALIAWLEMGGIYAVPNLRGGGEYGEDWHEAGMKEKKQNVFDDFIAAAEWLIANRYTSSEKLAISGRSNGGLLVGACMTQRPELFAAALPGVGVLDMLRFHKFTIGWAWTSEYGSSENAEEFASLHRYSPLHNLKPGTRYPSTLIITADHDDRVVPAHSFKFAAALQESHCGKNPVLIRIETRAGHGAGKPTTKIIEEAADQWAFLSRELKMELSNELRGSK